MNLADHEHCTGCSACANVCPKDAIDMRPDPEGFLQPIIDEGKCVACGACERACPIVMGPKFRPEQIEKKPLCGISNDVNVWRDSSSGGAFTEICNSIAERDPVVFGAHFAACDRVEMGWVENVADIGDFRKSKYVQADMRDCLRKCREFLIQGRAVIFSGTPCQIAGLRTYLGKEYHNLLAIEFICHGVGSPKVFSDSIREMSKNRMGRIVRYGFRSKLKWPVHDERTSLHERLIFGKWHRTCLVDRDLYNRFFLNQLCLRRSCMENCQYRNSDRYADITIADCRGERELYPNKDNKNWSVVVANTARGDEIASKLKARMLLNPYPIELLQRTNPLYFHTTTGNVKRADFFAAYLAGESLTLLARKFVPDTRDYPIRFFIARCLRFFARKINCRS